MLKIVTITGVDERTDLNRVERLSLRYPFVEWGVLVSKSQISNNRFPGEAFLTKLSMQMSYRLDRPKPSWVAGEDLSGTMERVEPIRFAIHLCGTYARCMLQGNLFELAPLAMHWPIYDRVQLNLPPDFDEVGELALAKIRAIFSSKQFIMQVGTSQNQTERYLQMKMHGINTKMLFDKSGGRGVSPNEWPMLGIVTYMGYAGGLGPDNLGEQLSLINKAAGESDYWIDMETGVRTDDWLDLDKVEAVLAYCEEYMINQNPLTNA